MDFGLLHLPGSSGRDYSIQPWHSKFCKAFPSFRRIWHDTAQETGSVTSPLCTATFTFHGWPGTRFSAPQRIWWTSSRPKPCEELTQVPGSWYGAAKGSLGVEELKKCAQHKLSMGVGGLITQKLPWGPVSQKLSFTGRKKEKTAAKDREKILQC